MNLQAASFQNAPPSYNSIVEGGCNVGHLPNIFRPQMPSASDMILPQDTSFIMTAIQELTQMVRQLANYVMGRGSDPAQFQAGQLRQLTPEQAAYLGQAQPRAAKAPSQSKGVRGLMHKGADWLVNKGYDWLNKKLDGSLDSLNSISTNTFGKIWDGASKIGSAVLDKASGIGSSIANSLSSIGSSILSGVGSLFGI